MKGLGLYVSMLFFCLSLGLHAQNGVYLPRVFESDSGVNLNYNIMFPHDFKDDGSVRYPVFLFLHGAGERGSDNNAQLIHGSKVIQDSLRKYPAIVIFPQCPKEDYWVNRTAEGQGKGRRFEFITDQGPTQSLEALMQMLERVLHMNYTDADRFYVAGLSMGGMGTIELGWRMSDKIAAAIAICGGGPKEKVDELVKVPFWFIHGVEDSVVPMRYSMMMVRAMQVNGGKARISLFPGVNHNSWDNAFADPEFFSWMFSKRRGE